jgi:phosphoesterase RecJ-like protein
MTTMPPNLSHFFSAYGTYIIAGHKEPDGDCLGSSLALDSFLRRRGKKTILVSAGPFKRPETKKYESLFVASVAPETMPADTALVVLDCSNIERLGDAARGLESFPAAIIDHHATNDSTHEFSFVSGKAPSTAFLVQTVIEAIDGPVTKEEAELLLFGMCTDTGYFRHLDATSAETFEHTARLVAAGANPKKTFAAMNGGKSFGSRILISRLLSRMVTWYSGRLVITYETIEDTQEYGLEGRDSDSLYQLIQSIAGVEAIVVVRQETETTCSVGFRSLDRVDVSVVAAAFGGGGHRQASGLNVEGTIDDLIPRFVKAFEPQFA